MRNFFAALNTLNQGLPPQNLLLWSEQFTNSIWEKFNDSTITGNTTVAPDGSTTADTFTTTGNFGILRQSKTVIPNNEYTFSFFALRGTMTDMKYSIVDATNSNANIVAPTSYFNLTSSSEWIRIILPFTTPSGCILIRCNLLRDSTAIGNCFVWGGQLNEGPIRPYVKTEGTIIP